MSIDLHIEEDIRSVFAERDLASYDALMTGDVGQLLGCDPGGRELRRITLGDEADGVRFYLKRLGREPLLRLLRMCLYGHRPRSGPLREWLLLDRLRAAGFATMAPVAWGERRLLGWPLEGFLLVREVPGRDVASCFDAFAPVQRRALIASVGRLIGRLHAQGFYHPVRLKDLILDEAGQGDADSLVLIDRETSKPWPSRFSRQFCLTSLARTYRRTIRDGHVLGPGCLSAFLRAYAQALRSCWDVSPSSLLRQLAKSTELKQNG